MGRCEDGDCTEAAGYEVFEGDEPFMYCAAHAAERGVRVIPQQSFFEAYKVGLVHASVCTNLHDAAAEEMLNVERPTGVTPWRVSDDATFSGGEPNPMPCPDRGDCRHILFVC